MTTRAQEERRLVSAWVEQPLADRLDQAARAAYRSRSAELRLAIAEHLEREAEEGTDE